MRGPVTLDFTAESRRPTALAVAYTEYSLDGGLTWVKGTSVTIKRQGVTVVSYRSADTRGNVEQARTCTVRIDRVAPVVFGYGRTVARQGRLMRCTYRGDRRAVHQGHREARGQAGRQQERQDLRPRRPATGRRLTTAVKCTLGTGTWVWRVTARDQAGNMGRGPWRPLVVTRR